MQNRITHLLTHPTCGYRMIIEQCTKRRTDLEKTQIANTAAIYLIFNDSNLNLDNLWYIGFTRSLNSETIFKSRICTHRKDLVAMHLNKNCVIHVYKDLTEEEAHVLEAYFINKTNKPLTKPGCFELLEGYLANKKREKKWECLINKYLEDGDNPFTFTWR